ncbi:MAG: DNA cytosine methyltransferase [Candidatus Kapabacteria bacterium]|nr:DNA cytosine methyltransferase [Candidatus Kapabacteria bacterium]
MFQEKNDVITAKSFVSNKHFETNITNGSIVKPINFINEFEIVPFPPIDNYNFTFIDLFAGIGGFRLALQNIGGKCLYTSEWNSDAKITYSLNFGEVPFGDITNDLNKSYIPQSFEILCAGFPCQAFSIAGYRKGFADTRGTLFFDIEQIVERHRPKVVFLENVKNLVSHDKGNTFKTIIETLEDKLGYKTFAKVLNTADYANVPQNRERIFIVAFDTAQVQNFKKFQFPQPIRLTKSIHDFLEKEKQDDIFYYKENHPYYTKLEKSIISKDTMYQWRRTYVRENKSNLCPTLTANMGSGGHNVPLIKDNFGIRKLTPKECFALQGYPIDKYIIPNIANSKLYMQAGNSVTTTLVERIANQIIKVL